MSEHTELAALMPWTVAQPDSLWIVSGRQGSGSFTRCIARALPSFVTGTDGAVFEVLTYAQTGFIVPASSVEYGRELLLVYADEPLEAFYERDQATVDAGAREYAVEFALAAAREALPS